MMTDMSKCSQIQVIFQEQLHGHDLPRHTQPPLVEGPPHPQEHPLGLGAVADVQQSSFRLGSFNLVSGDILCTLQQLHLNFLLRRPFLLVAALHAECTTQYQYYRQTHGTENTSRFLAFPSTVSDKVVCHTCTVVFCRFLVWLYMEG